MKELEAKILEIVVAKALDWDYTLIEVVCEDLEMTEDQFRIVFPNEIESLADYFFKIVDDEMLTAIDEKFVTLPIHLQVSKLLSKLFDLMDKQKPLALKVLHMECSLTYKLIHVAKTADLIWNNVNHKSSSFDYYTRRMILATVYSNCLMHFKKYVSKEEMTEYIKTQLKTVGKITKLKKKFFKHSLI